MKTKTKTKTNIIITTSLIVLTLILAPSVGFASVQPEEAKFKNKLETKFKAENARGHFSNSFWARFFTPFGYLKAKAATNAGTKPIVNNTSLPSISGITAPVVLKVGQQGTWTIKASDPLNQNLSYSVKWGDEENQTSSKSAIATAFVQESTFTHTYNKPGVYKVVFTVKNSAGVEARSSVSVKVKGDMVVIAPVISALSATSDKPHKGEVAWKTDVKSSSMVWYSKTSPVNTSNTPHVVKLGKLKDHKINLTKLEANTKYYVVVGSQNSAGLTKSSEISFTTAPTVNETSPKITKLDGPSTISAGNLVVVTVNAYDLKNSPLSYSVDWGDNNAANSIQKRSPTTFTQNASFSHIYNTPGTYKATFTVENTEGKSDTSSMRIVVTSDLSVRHFLR